MTAFVQKNLAAISSVGGGGGGGEGSGDASVNPGAPVQIPNFENSNFPSHVNQIHTQNLVNSAEENMNR